MTSTLDLFADIQICHSDYQTSMSVLCCLYGLTVPLGFWRVGDFSWQKTGAVEYKKPWRPKGEEEDLMTKGGASMQLGGDFNDFVFTP